VIIPLFAITLPALLLLCCIALNIAQFRVLRTELQVAADTSAHAAGRAMSVYQDVDKTITFAKQFAQLNKVGNQPFELEDSQIQFGRSTRPDSNSRYSFTEVPLADARSLKVIPNSVGIQADGDYPVLLAALTGRKTIRLVEKAVATQIDRDVILVLDRSGSMLTYKDDLALDNALYTLYSEGKISKTEYDDAKNDNFSANVHSELTGNMKDYATDRRSSSTNPARYSRWAQLEKGVDAFLDVVAATDQVELVGLVMFSSNATLEHELTSKYSDIQKIVDKTKPSGSTAIGSGMEAAVPELFQSSRARPFASKTIVVLTDGINNAGRDPFKVAQEIAQAYSVTIHTVTFSDGADLKAMINVAAVGGGNHYHSDTGDDLVPIFREIANNLPTILTQ
jgi:Mg-chelatase subunit ChlD